MKWKEIKGGKQRTFAVIFDHGDDPVRGLTDMAKELGLGASQITGIGAFDRAVLGFFDWQRKDYRHIPVNEQVEVVALLGDIAIDDAGKPKLHLHVVLAKGDGIALGGHLLQAEVRPTLEVVLTESPKHLHRVPDAESGLALIRL